ncbi:MAG: cupin domain-containing protein [Lentisphaerales bacterium]|jgi:quercetin dioxygenase-like cupin family protein|nr:MAG: cupin domain-containing protein [Lentisphaerales bacterium]
MSDIDAIKGEPVIGANEVAYSDGSVVSRTLLERKGGSLTLFAFDAGQGLSEHTSPYDATVEVLDGEAEITIGAAVKTVRQGEMIIMPATVPHALRAAKRFKMLLIMIR